MVGTAPVLRALRAARPSRTLRPGAVPNISALFFNTQKILTLYLYMLS